MIYAYKGYDKGGKVVSDKLTASNLDEAKVILYSRGILIENIKEKKPLFTPKINNSDLSSISRNISIYLNSSIPLYKAINLLKNSYKNSKRMLLWLNSIEESLKKGSTFKEALESQVIYKLPDFYLYSIDVAEKSSNLSSTLRDLGVYISSAEKTKKEVVKAFVYPTFIIFIAIIIVQFMLTNIVPSIVDIFSSMDTELPTSTKITLALSGFMEEYAEIFMVLFLIVVFLIGFFWQRKGRFRYFGDKFLLKIPLIKTVILNFELGRFSKVSSLLLKNGVPFAESLHFSSKTFSNLALKQSFGKIADQVVEGKPFFEAVKSQKDVKIPADFLSAVAIGEDSSELPTTLETLSELYEENNQDKISVLLSLLEPILLILVGGVIGFIVVSMLLPIFSISIQQ
jgi:general secretion pathway protein F/type IV pilus assembly protein PilC